MNLRSASFLAAAAVTTAGLFTLAAGCELIAAPDRSIIPEGSGGGTGGSGGTGGEPTTSSGGGQGGTGGETTSSGGGQGGTGGGEGGSGGVGQGGTGGVGQGGTGGVGQGGSGQGGSGQGGSGQGGAGGSAPECTLPGDCPPTGNECINRTCVAGTCGTMNVSTGTPLANQTAGDCQTAVCNGSGGVSSLPDDADINDDNETCTTDTCNLGIPIHTPVLVGTACNENGGAHCSATGTCVECTDNSHCLVTGYCDLTTNTCVAPTCSDGVQNGTETGVDCGGTCGACNNSACTQNTDCASHNCYENICAAALNGCDFDTATDLTNMSGVTITFANGNFTYAPKCIKVTAGTVATFNGNFVNHNLQGGTLVGGLEVPAATGPFVPATTTGSTMDFTLASAGSYPYYCIQHGSTQNMGGAIFVVP
jgi:plastocyanin